MVKKIIFLCLMHLVTQTVFAESATPFTITSSAVKESGQLPAMYTCDGKDIQPDFTWKNAPANTQSFALILSDPDAPRGTFYHWVIYNIPATVSSLPKAMTKLPAGALLGNNSWNKSSYNGPCPPQGATHHYILTLYALDATLTLSSYENAATLLDAMQSHMLANATLTMTYARH